MEEKKLRDSKYYQSIQNLIEGFAIQKKNSRLVFVILLILVVIIYNYK